MLDLIMLGWPWFAGAGALGALTGYVTSSREKTAAVAPGWVFLTILLALGAGAAASAGGVFEGRAALTFDIVLAASAAYAFALPLGRFAKLLGASDDAERVTVAAIAAVAKPAAAPQPIAIEEAASEKVAAGPDEVSLVEAPAVADAAVAVENVAIAAEALSAKAIEMRGKEKAAKKPSGQRPSTLAAPRGAADDLTRIKGLGPKSAAKLNALGIFHYDQIAGWSRDNAKWIGAEIGVASRVERDEWVAQARMLADIGEERSAASAA